MTLRRVHVIFGNCNPFWPLEMGRKSRMGARKVSWNKLWSGLNGKPTMGWNILSIFFNLWKALSCALHSHLPWDFLVHSTASLKNWFFFSTAKASKTARQRSASPFPWFGWSPLRKCLPSLVQNDSKYLSTPALKHSWSYPFAQTSELQSNSWSEATGSQMEFYRGTSFRLYS